MLEMVVVEPQCQLEATQYTLKTKAATFSHQHILLFSQFFGCLHLLIT